MRVDGYNGNSCAWVRLDLQARFYPVGMVIKRCFPGVLSRALFPCSVLSGTPLVSYRARRTPRRFIFQAVKVGRRTGAAFRPFRNVTPNAFLRSVCLLIRFCFYFRSLFVARLSSFVFWFVVFRLFGVCPLVGVWNNIKTYLSYFQIFEALFFESPFFRALSGTLARGEFVSY